MTLEQFNDLDELEQLQAVWEAVFIGEKKTDKYLINLYQIDEFFVEEYFDIAIDARARFFALYKEELLDVYLEQFTRGNNGG